MLGEWDDAVRDAEDDRQHLERTGVGEHNRECRARNALDSCPRDSRLKGKRSRSGTHPRPARHGAELSQCPTFGSQLGRGGKRGLPRGCSGQSPAWRRKGSSFSSFPSSFSSFSVFFSDSPTRRVLHIIRLFSNLPTRGRRPERYRRGKQQKAKEGKREEGDSAGNSLRPLAQHPANCLGPRPLPKTSSHDSGTVLQKWQAAKWPRVSRVGETALGSPDGRHMFVPQRLS